MKKVKVTPFSLWLKNERLKRGMTQGEFGDLLGASFATIVNLEKAKTKPRLKTQKAMVKELHIDFETLQKMMEAE